VHRTVHTSSHTSMGQVEMGGEQREQRFFSFLFFFFLSYSSFLRRGASTAAPWPSHTRTVRRSVRDAAMPATRYVTR
jgi:hypothetical protein